MLGKSYCSYCVSQPQLDNPVGLLLKELNHHLLPDPTGITTEPGSILYPTAFSAPNAPIMAPTYNHLARMRKVMGRVCRSLERCVWSAPLGRSTLRSAVFKALGPPPVRCGKSLRKRPFSVSQKAVPERKASQTSTPMQNMPGCRNGCKATRF